MVLGYSEMNDKIQHFLAGFGLSIFGLLFLPFILNGFLFGIGKEVYDKITGKGVTDFNDLVATFCGATFASMIVLVVI